MRKSITFATFYASLASAFAYLVTILIAREYSQSFYSEYALSMVCAMIIIQICDFASEQSISPFRSKNAISSNNFIAAISLLKIFLLSLIIIFNFIFDLAGLNSIPWNSFFLILPLFYLHGFFEYITKASFYAAIIFIERLSIFILVVISLALGIDGSSVFKIYFFVTLIVVIFQFLYFKFELKKFSIYKVIKNYLLNYYFVFLSLLIQMGYGHFSRLIIESKSDLITFGAVTIGFQLVNSFGVLYTQIDRHFRPEINKLVTQGDMSELYKLNKLYLKNCLVPLFFLSFMIFILSDYIILFIFTEKWIAASSYLQAFSPMLLSASLIRYVDIYMVALSRQKTNFYINFLLVAGLMITMLSNNFHDISNFITLIVMFQFLHALIALFYIRSFFQGNKSF